MPCPKLNWNHLQQWMHRRLSFNSIINTFLTVHNHWCQQSIRKRWNTLALPNYFPCALTCVCVCAHLNNLNQPDIIIFHLQLLKRTFLWAPRAHLHQRLQRLANTDIYYDLQRQRSGREANEHVRRCYICYQHQLLLFRRDRLLEKLDRLTMHLVGINLFIKTLAGIQQVWNARTK